MGVSVDICKVNMAFLLRSSGSRLLVRQFSAAAEGPSAKAGEHGGGLKLWKVLSLTVALPGIALSWYAGFKKEHEFKLSWHQPEMKEYAHLQIRQKPFFYGDGKRTIFHNPQTNVVPGEGYDEEYKAH